MNHAVATPPLSGVHAVTCHPHGMTADPYLDVAGRRFEVKELAAEGYSLRQIADRIGVSHETVRRDLHAMAGEPSAESAEPSDRDRDVDRQGLHLVRDPPLPEAWRQANLDSAIATATPTPVATATEWPVCGRCGTRHEPRPVPLPSLGATSVLPDPGRPEPLGRSAPTVVRRGLSPWGRPIA